MREHVPVLIQKQAAAFGRQKWRLSGNDVEVDKHRDDPRRIRRDRGKRGVSFQCRLEIDLGFARLRNRHGQNGSKCEAADHHGDPVQLERGKADQEVSCRREHRRQHPMTLVCILPAHGKH